MKLSESAPFESLTLPQKLQGDDTGARILTRALVASGIQFVFGIPGTHNIEFYDAMAEEPALTPILVTDEQSAGFMADGAFRASGTMAALSLVPGAGLTHALSGIAEAFFDQIPMLVLMCAPRHDLSYGYQLHGIDQAALAQAVVKKVLKATHHQDLWSLTRYAHALALQAPAGPVALEIPAELLFKTGSYDTLQPYPALPRTPSTFSLGDFEAIVKSLSRAQHIGLYLGRGASMPAQLLENLAEHLDAVVFTSISGKGIFPENNPRFVWNGMGRALPPTLRSLEQTLDCVLAIGCRFSEVATASYGFHFQGELLHVDIDETVFHRNYPADHVLKADAESFVKALLAASSCQKKVHLPLEHETAIAQGRWRVRAELSTQKPELGVNPTCLLQALQTEFGPHTIFVTDSGNGLFKAMEGLELSEAQSFLAPVDFSCMGYCVPAAIGAKLAQPDRSVVGLVGDGAVLMTGLEMATARTYGLGILFIVLNDGKLGQIAQFQAGATGREIATEVHGVDFAAFAAALRLEYLACEQTDALEPVLSRAHALCREGRPVILAVKTDYSIPSFFTRAVIKSNFARLEWGDRWRMARRLMKRKILQ